MYAARHEMATTLIDVLTRRTRAHLFDRPATLAAAPDVADLLAGRARLGRRRDRGPGRRLPRPRRHRGGRRRRRHCDVVAGVVMEPTPPIELTGAASRWPGGVDVPDRRPGPAGRGGAARHDRRQDPGAVAEASRDWWPLALHWALAGEVPRVAAAVARPRSVDEVAAVIARLCRRRGPADRRRRPQRRVRRVGAGLRRRRARPHRAGRDRRRRRPRRGVVEVARRHVRPRPRAASCRPRHGLSVGHFPQSFDLATVGGWVACRGAGQYSTRYGKIEDLVVGLEVVLADGTIVRTGGAPAAAVGPDLTQLFVGSEGTLGIVTRVWLRTHPVPPAEGRAAFTFATFADGVDACRQVLRRGATPAVLRLYDEVESARGRGGDGVAVDAARARRGRPDDRRRPRWPSSPSAPRPASRRRTSARRRLAGAPQRHQRPAGADPQGLRRRHDGDRRPVVAAGRAVRRRCGPRCSAVPHARVASCHLSHSYPDGACLYFTFAATPPADEVESTYVALWDAGQRAVLAHGGNLSHHHGVGLNRARFVAEALGPAFGVLATLKAALDPAGHPQPGQARPALPLRRRTRGRGGERGGTPTPCGRGAGVAVVFAVPFAVLGRIALSEDWSDTSSSSATSAMIGGLFLGAGIDGLAATGRARRSATASSSPCSRTS